MRPRIDLKNWKICLFRCWYNCFYKKSNKIIKKKVNNVLSQLASYLIEKRGEAEEKINQLSIDKIKKLVIEAKFKNVSSDIERLQDNNICFRPHDKYLLFN